MLAGLLLGVVVGAVIGALGLYVLLVKGMSEPR
jgi:hypothetical protein